jgi:hypothetical protein
MPSTLSQLTICPVCFGDRLRQYAEYNPPCNFPGLDVSEYPKAKQSENPEHGSRLPGAEIEGQLPHLFEQFPLSAGPGGRL